MSTTETKAKPWHVNGQVTVEWADGACETFLRIDDLGPDTEMSTDAIALVPIERPEDAACIVRRCNLHEELVAEVRLAKQSCSCQDPSRCSKCRRRTDLLARCKQT